MERGPGRAGIEERCERSEEKQRRFRLVKLEERRFRMDKLEDRIAPSATGHSQKGGCGPNSLTFSFC